MGKCIMPQVYVIGGNEELPNDGKTYGRLRVTIATGTLATISVYKSDAFTLTFDWGDGTQTNNTGTSAQIINHNYSTAGYGDYVVSMWISSGTGVFDGGQGGSASKFFGNTAEKVQMLTEFKVGDNCRLGSYGSAFANNYALKKVTLTGYGYKSLANSIFSGNYGCTTYIIDVPTVVISAGVNIFLNINTSTKIYVPDDLVDDYKMAANWTTYADYIYPISDKGVTHNDQKRNECYF